MNENPLKTINVTFSNNDLFHINCLVDRNRFLENKLSNLTISGDEFYMISLEYKPYENKEWFADSHTWIFNRFYKLLKKEKYDKLMNECFNDHEMEYSEEYIILFMSNLELNRKSLLKLLKSIKTEYNLSFE